MIQDAMMIGKLGYWLARRICRRHARDYIHVVDRMGLEWTLALIAEDAELSGHASNHAFARAGVIDYAERTGLERVDKCSTEPGNRVRSY